MKYTRFIVIAFMVMSLTYLSFVVYQNTKEKFVQTAIEQKPPQNQWETKTDARGLVSITVTPQIFKEDSQWKFDMVLDTHVSIELDQDLLQIAVLVDDQGNTYRPIAWDGAGPGGHHREGVLTFNQIVPASKSIELKISDIGDVVKSFVWQLK